MKFNENLVLMGCQAEDANDVIAKLCHLMEEQGMVTPSYLEAVLAREEEYPTGVPTAYFDVAIPHAPCDNVLEPGFAIAQLKSPVEFGSMGGADDEKVSAELVFLLAVKEPHSQLEMLRALMRAFTNEEAMYELQNAQSPSSMYSTVQKLGLI